MKNHASNTTAELPPDPNAIAQAVRVLRQIGVVNEVALVRHILTADDERRVAFAEHRDLLPDAELVATVQRERLTSRNGKGLIRAAIDGELQRFAGRPLPTHYASSISTI